MVIMSATINYMMMSQIIRVKFMNEKVTEVNQNNHISVSILWFVPSIVGSSQWEVKRPVPVPEYPLMSYYVTAQPYSCPCH